MKKDSFEKKLASYVALASSILAANVDKVDAQIMYTDVRPDLIIDNSFFNLDLNNDGVYDIKLQNSNEDIINWATNCNGCSATFHNSEKAQIFAASHEVVVESFYGYFIVKPLNSGDTIGVDNIFGDGNVGSGAILKYNRYSGYWSCGGYSSFTGFSYGIYMNGEKFLGFQIFTGGNKYYGWARIELGGDAEIILKDYAINLTPDSSIIAGDTGSACTINNISNSPSGLYFLCNNSIDVHLNNSNSLNVQWFKNGIKLTGETDSTYTLNQIGEYQALVSDSSCSVLINAIHAVTVEFTIQSCISDANCGSADGSIAVTVTGNSPGYLYNWSNGMTTEGIANVPAGTYEVTVTSNICPESEFASYIINSNQISIPPIVQFGNALIAPSQFISYQWLLSGFPISGATNQSYNPTQVGYYSVIVGDSIGCVGQANTYFYFVSINEIANPEINLLIDSKYLQIIFTTERFIGSQLRLFNSTGQLVSEMTVTKNIEMINIEQLPKGIYILSIRNGDENRNYKIAIVN